jgi:hypothetical protein
MYDNYDVIAVSISAIRPLLRNLSLPKDKLILDAYEELSVFIVSNFNLPLTHKEYIPKNLGLPVSTESFDLLSELDKKIKSIKHNYSLELPLRALEVYFSFGKPIEIDIFILTKLKYLVAKLHYLSGENYRFD